MTASGIAVQLRASVNGGWLSRATAQTAVRYITGTNAIASSIAAFPSFMWTSVRRVEMSCVWMISSAIHNVNISPWNSTAGGRVGFGRG